MRYVAILGIVCLGTISLASGCSDGGDGNSGGAGGSGNSSSSSSSSSNSSSSGEGGSMASSSSSSSASSSGGTTVNGCDSATAEDHLADAMVTINVGLNGFTFTPACIRIKKGAQVTYSGSFTAHPLVGGLAGPPPMPDSASPIKETTAGSSVTFTFDTVGMYPYYCEYHAPAMAGVVYVE